MAKIIGGIVLVLILIGAFFIWQGKNAGAPTVATESGAGTPEATPSTGAPSGKQVITSIQDAMGLGTQMKCSVALGDGTSAATTTMYVAGKKFMTQMVANGATTNVFFDGETQYVWSDQNKQGTKMSKTCLESFKGEEPDAAPRDYSTDFDAAKNVQCEPIEMQPLSVPEGITFTDQCAMMQESLKLMEGVKDKLPAGMNIPNVPGAAY